MAIENQEPLFTEVPDKEYQARQVRTWKDNAGAPDTPPDSRDEFDRLDDQARLTTGQTRLEASGMSRRRAERLQNVGAARMILEQSARETAEREEVERVRREQEETEKILGILRG